MLLRHLKGIGRSVHLKFSSNLHKLVIIIFSASLYKFVVSDYSLRFLHSSSR
ncbi:hypothetical protein Pelsub_P0253 [Pelolinea submarina]|nr:hypothetical protein Pelsub_P0253 [Pelolinea submarina]